MGNINNKVKELDPHVLSIRFTNGLTVIDCAFKDGWSLPKSEIVGVQTTPDKANYHMLYPLNETVGIDEMLEYVSYVIKVNIERELKIKLLQIKINELKKLFTKSSLDKCKTIEFSFKHDLDVSNNEDIDLSDMPIIIEDDNDTGENVIIEGGIDESELTENDGFSDGFDNVNPTTAKFNNETFDLPPKTKNGKIVVETFDEPEVVCKCDPNDENQVCPRCIEGKY